jgi:hypothetical protein
MNRKTVSIGVICIFIGVLFSSNIIAEKQDTEFIEYSLVSYDSLWKYNSSMGGWCIEFPAVPINDSIVWSTEILDAYVAYLSFTHVYDFESYYFYNSTSDEEFEYESNGYLELSADDGETWYILGLYSGDSGGNDSETFDISYWAFNEILIRFRVEGVGDDYFANESGGFWCFWDLKIFGMVDNTPPVSTISVTSTGMWPWSSSALGITIEAHDGESGVKEIHYKLNGIDIVTLGDYYYDDVDESGSYNLEYWAVDWAGNEELPHNIVPPFGVDMEKPQLEIIEPLSGIYFFGKKILPSNKLIIIGNFTIKVDAYDNLSGMKHVEFLLNGDSLGYDTEEPYEMNIAVRNIGLTTIKIIAEDNVGWTVEEIFDVYYYKFF